MGPGEREPLRIAGYCLLGVAAIAAIIGLIHLASGGSDAATPSDTANQAAPASDSATPSAAPLAPPAPGTPNQLAAPAPAAQPPAAAPAPAAPAPAPAPAPAQAPAPAPAKPAPAKPLPGAGLPADNAPSTGKGSSGYSSSYTKSPTRVYNNSLIHGLAERAAADIRESGWTVTEVGNYSSGNVATSTVYYRPGTSEQAAAKHLASSLGMIAAPRFSGIEGASPGLIIIVTKDYQQR
jgi:hypothetical protein